MAPELTSTTLCPWALSATTVSTMDERSWRRGGNGGLAATMDEVPKRSQNKASVLVSLSLSLSPSLMTMVMGWTFRCGSGLGGRVMGAEPVPCFVCWIAAPAEMQDPKRTSPLTSPAEAMFVC